MRSFKRKILSATSHMALCAHWLQRYDGVERKLREGHSGMGRKPPLDTLSAVLDILAFQRTVNFDEL